ncbi:MAG: hypothetical protein WD382_07965 [Halofilum sp. (in: g-proteobacteria)]
MRLRTLEIQQLPGTGAFRIEGLAPGANLITGPNAVGKSSLIRALRYLIGGARTGDPAALALAAEFDDGGHTWRVQRAGGQVLWTREGAAVEPPALPDADLLHCYWLRVEDLLRDDGRDDAALVKHLRSALSGGFDLDAIRAYAPFDFGPQTGRRQAAALQEERATRQRIESEHEALRREAAGLPELKAQAESAEQAARRLGRLEQALSLLAARRARLATDEQLARFPADMARLRGDELESLAGLEQERAQCGQTVGEQERARQDAAERLAETGFAQTRPSESNLQAQREHLAERRRHADRLDAERERLAEHQAQEQSAALELGGTALPPRLDPASIGEAETLAGRLHRARRALDDRRARLEAWDADTPSADTRPWLGWAVLAMLGAGAAAVAASLTSEPRGVAAAATAIAAGVIGFIGAAHRALATHHAGNYHARRRRELATELTQAETELEECAREQQALCARCGIDPERFEGAALERYFHLAADLDRAREARITSERRIAAIEAQVAAEANQVCDFLAHWETRPATTDGTDLKAALDAFADRCQRAAELAQAERAAQRERDRLQQSLAQIDARIGQLYGAAELEPGERRTLEERCAAHEEWRQCRDARERAVHIEEERRQPLIDEAELIARIEADDESQLRAERDELERQSSHSETLRKQVFDLEQRLERAGREGELERAAAAEERARDALAEQFDQAMLAEAGHLLLDGVAAEFRNEHEPAVLQDARARFARFTHHAWSLEVDPQRGFHALEHASEQRRSLSELSSGTRMQLLLAVRMAWARQIEREKTPLPLFLDEALTTSDEARFGEVAASLEQLVEEEGRQVFYLSARRQEATIWERATGKRPQVLDLAEIRFGTSEAAAEDYALPPVQALPDPGTLSADEYAALLGVPSVDPRQPAASIHLFHLLRDDLRLLHTLLEQWRIPHLGALEALLASEAADQAVPGPHWRTTLATRCRAARHWTALWRTGRGKPVDRGVLEASEHVTQAFIERVSELAFELDGDGEALIEALRAGRVSRFRTSSTDALEEWLRTHGYIDTTDPLAPDERERRTLQSGDIEGDPADLRLMIRWLDAGAGDTAHALAQTTSELPA